MRLHTIACSALCLAGMSWLYYSFTKAAPKPSLNRQVGRLNPRLIWENPILVGNISSSLRQELQVWPSMPGHPPGCHQLSQTWHSHHPLAPEPLKHPWTKPALRRMDTSSPSASVYFKALCVQRQGLTLSALHQSLRLWIWNSTVQLLPPYSITSSCSTSTDSIFINISQVRILQVSAFQLSIKDIL